ncbi:MAG: DNA repair protein RecO [Proteobacteria bacterium]|nr:MAG: DNA repair protein RecO [Pseudomonadota bacterium]
MSGAPERWDGSALVLSSADSNSDRILRFITEDDRLVAAVARRARRSAKRGQDRLQPLSLASVALTLRERDDLAVVNRGSTDHAFATLKGDLIRYALATTMAEVVLLLVHEFGREAGVYQLLGRAWRALDDPTREPGEDLLLLFELRALALGGTLPPPESLTGLSPAARETLAAWLEGRWRPLPDADRGRVARTLEGFVADASGGRRLKSRAFLDQVLP